MTNEEFRKQIITTMFDKPVIGRDYVDYHLESGECCLQVTINGEIFDITIKKKD